MPNTAAERAVQQLVDAIVGCDLDGAVEVLDPHVYLRFLIPSGRGELVGAAAAAGKILGWFVDADAIEVGSAVIEPVGDRISARYRLDVHEDGRWEVVEEQLYLDIGARGKIVAIDLLCAGFQPVDEPAAHHEQMTDVHRFDAGTLGCADGLAPAFRKRIGAIPLGDLLEIETGDPSAKEDLPSLARMMGHTVHAVEPTDGGRLLITVERGR